MKKILSLRLIFVSLVLQSACAPIVQPSETTSATKIVPSITAVKCRPTLDDGVSPSYIPNAPERTVVGHGHFISGVVLSSVDCKPIANAKLEFWPEYEGLGHPDSAHATFYTDKNGEYRFECDQPEHIHMKISAEGYRTIGVNSYHPEGAAEGMLDIVLEPE